MEDHRCNVRVGVRVRPLSNSELAADSRQVISYPGRDVISIGDGKGDKSFTFDHVFPAHMSQQELYESTAAPMLQSFLDGYNVTVLAYGQTGSGKTFTMGSECGASDDHQGLIPRFVEEIFARVAAPTMESHPRDENSAVVCNPLVSEQPEAAQQLKVAAPFATVSFLEIYGEDIFDLLQEPDTEGKTKSLQLREESGAVAVVGLMEVAISESCEAMDMLRAGTRHRTTASTLMNTVSSRSHAVFTITLHQTLFGGAHGEEGQEVVSKLSFVDLAGSERLKRTGAEGQRMKEGIQINKGLLALGNVINALADEEALKKREKVHVGYRESKLTRLLQDALGGNSQTLFLACVSPAEVNISETLSTLRYANRARNIQNKPVKNTDPLTEELRMLHELNNGLRLELVKEHFHVAASEADDDLQALLDRDDVKAYMEGLNQRLNAGSSDLKALLRPPAHSAATGAFAAPFVMPPGSMAGTAAALVASARRVSVAHFQKRQSLAHLHPLPSVGEPTGPEDAGEKDPSLAQCEEPLDPENDICMINKLLEMLKKDEEFDKSDKKHEADIGSVDTEISQKEEILKHLKHNIEQYQVLLEENDLLVRELQSLEGEKQQLLSQVAQHEKKGAAEPTTYVLKLKEKLQAVESRLKSQASEQKKREDAMALIKRDTSRVKELEGSISGLKRAKVDMVKKQKDAAAHFKTFMDLKNKELIEVRKTRQREKLASSKLESENRKLVTMMSRKVKAHQKTEEALQKNKAHLVKLLAMRKRERQRQTTSTWRAGGAKAGGKAKAKVPLTPEDAKEAVWAPENEAVQSAKFTLAQLVSDRAEKQLRHELEGKLVGEFDALQQQVLEVVANLNKLKKLEEDEAEEVDHHEEEGEAFAAEVVEHEERLEELIVKLDLVSNALSETHLPANEEAEGEEEEALELELVGGLDAPALRTTLWSLLDEFSDLEYQKRLLAEAYRRKEAEVKAAEAKVARLEQANGDLQRSFHDRVRNMHAERLEYAQAVCSPTGKKQQSGALRALNADLEEKLEDEKEARALAEAEAKALRAKTADACEQLEVAHVALQQAAPGEGNPLTGLIQNIQAVWTDLGTSEGDRRAMLAEIRESAGNSASGILAQSTLAQGALQGRIVDLEGKLTLIARVLGVEAATLLPQEPMGSRQDHFARLVAARAGVEDEVAALLERTAAAHRKAGAFTVMLQAHEPAELPHLAQLLRLDPAAVFTAGLGDCAVLPLPALLEGWEASVRALAVRIGEVQAEQQATVATARSQLEALGVKHDVPNSLCDFKPSHDAETLAAACRFLLAAEPSPDAPGGPHSKALVACVKSLAAATHQTHAAHAEAAAVATHFLETWFVAVHNRLARDHEGLPPLGKPRLAALVKEVFHCLAKTRDNCASEVAKVKGAWEEHNTALEARVEIPAPWVRAGPGGAASLADAAAHLEGSPAVEAAKLRGLTLELKVACDEAQSLEERMGRVTEAMGKMDDRAQLQLSIVGLDEQLAELYKESTTFELKAKDPSRLQDRTGKGRKELANEEATRKQFQKSIRKALSDLQKALVQWEANEHEKFRGELLSEHGLSVRDAKSKDVVSGMTQLMHLESSMQVKGGNGGGERRNSGEPLPRANRDSSEGSNSAGAVGPSPVSSKSEAQEADAKRGADVFTTPARPSMSKAQKSNPFAKMMTSRKSTACTPASNRVLVEGDSPKLQEKTIAEQENVDPLC